MKWIVICLLGIITSTAPCLAQNAKHKSKAPNYDSAQPKCPTKKALPYDPDQLDIGIYWYSKSSKKHPKGIGCKAYQEGKAIAGFYDPNKPVLIFVHGWQLGYVGTGDKQSVRRIHFLYDAAKRNVADRWIKDGWNVGIFHWTQLADDDYHSVAPFNTQAKIWTPNYVGSPVLGKRQSIQMRYRVKHGFSYTNMPKKSIGQVFYDEYKKALQKWKYSGDESIRLLGHSLGSQVILSLADQAYKDPKLPKRLHPKRIILGDPYWSPATPALGHHYNYLAPDPNPASRSFRIAKEIIQQGVVIEWIKSTSLTNINGDHNLKLKEMISRAELKPDFLGINIVARHSLGWQWYLATKGHANNFIGAENDDESAWIIMFQRSIRIQQTGSESPKIDDDNF